MCHHIKKDNIHHNNSCIDHLKLFIVQICLFCQRVCSSDPNWYKITILNFAHCIKYTL